MRLRVREHSEAHEELLDAVNWYDSQRTGFGEDFLDAIETAVAQLVDQPEASRVYPGWNRKPVVRQGTMKTFPFQILYYIEGCCLIVVVYAHTRRKPGYWQRRI